jgi:hypothetical protein
MMDIRRVAAEGIHNRVISICNAIQVLRREIATQRGSSATSAGVDYGTFLCREDVRKIRIEKVHGLPGLFVDRPTAIVRISRAQNARLLDRRNGALIPDLHEAPVVIRVALDSAGAINFTKVRFRVNCTAVSREEAARASDEAKRARFKATALVILPKADSCPILIRRDRIPETLAKQIATGPHPLPTGVRDTGVRGGTWA